MGSVILKEELNVSSGYDDDDDARGVQRALQYGSVDNKVALNGFIVLAVIINTLKCFSIYF